MSIISNFSNEERTAVIHSLDSGGFEVLMYDSGHLKFSREVKNNIQYAEDLAENFVMKYGEFK